MIMLDILWIVTKIWFVFCGAVGVILVYTFVIGVVGSIIGEIVMAGLRKIKKLWLSRRIKKAMKNHDAKAFIDIADKHQAK